ncbi:MAG TPA: hypothetical protein PKD27_14350 [Tepidiformaceae bacterium]|nr:hypothetical protein [Tepidiformaceae bacterium]
MHRRVQARSIQSLPAVVGVVPAMELKVWDLRGMADGQPGE